MLASSVPVTAVPATTVSTEAASSTELGEKAKALAQSGSGYDLTWITIDDGGRESSGSGYTLNGTIGQADAGTLSGGGYTLAGGFWGGGSNQYKCTCQ